MRKFTIARKLILLYCLVFQSLTYAQDDNFTKTQIGPNNLLTTPWNLLYGPDGYLWITEKSVGNIVRINPETGERDDLIKISDFSTSGGQDGLLGLAFDNQFSNGSPYVYISYTHMVSSVRKQKLVRLTYTLNAGNGSLGTPVVLIDNLPSYKDHQSGRIVIDANNKLYYTIGDQGVKVCASNLAQYLPTQSEIDQKNWNNYPGKVLRINLDGSIPSDNPLFNGVRSHIYSIGHRNPQGLVLGTNGKLYSSEHGPSSDDEINIIESGKNYGWPFVAGIKDNLMYDSDGCLTTETQFNDPNYQDPLLSMFLPNAYKSTECTDTWMCRPNMAPSSIEIYEQSSIPNWQNSLLIPSLKKGTIYRVKLDSSSTKPVGTPTQHFYTTNRYRDIAIAPDGKSFYVITDGSGKTADFTGMVIKTTMENPGSILKFTYQETVSAMESENIENIKVWINSTEKTLHIKLNENITNAVLFNTMGQVVKYLYNLRNGENVIQISELPIGNYILKLKGENYQKTQTIKIK